MGLNFVSLATVVFDVSTDSSLTDIYFVSFMGFISNLVSFYQSYHIFQIYLWYRNNYIDMRDDISSITIYLIIQYNIIVLVQGVMDLSVKFSPAIYQASLGFSFLVIVAYYFSSQTLSDDFLRKESINENLFTTKIDEGLASKTQHG